MELVEELGARGVKTNRNAWGLFKCPSCLVNIEKPLRDGLRNKSCGSNYCRKAMFSPNVLNKGNSKEEKISDIQYYSAFKEKYSSIKNSHTVCEAWDTMQGFTDSMHASYVEARKLSGKVSFVCEEDVASFDSAAWKPIGLYTQYKTSTDKDKKYLYLVRAADFIKIGVTNRVGERVCQIQTGNPFEVDLLHAIEVVDAYTVEKMLHGKYTEFNKRGEWFYLSTIQIQEIKDYLDNL